MATRLRNPQWSKVDFVDRPADAHARMLIWKRDVEKRDTPITREAYDALSDEMKRFYRWDPKAGEFVPVSEARKRHILKREFSKDRRDDLASKGHALPDGSFPIVTKGDLSNAIQAFGRAKDKDRARRHIIKRARALGATDMLPDNWNVTKRNPIKEEGTMPRLTDEVRKSLDPTVQAYIANLEKNQRDEGDGAPGAGDDITKREDLPEDVRKRFEDMNARVEAAEKVAKAERDARLEREWRDRVESISLFDEEEVGKVAKSLKDLADTDEDLATTMVETMKGLSTKAEAAGLFSEVGKNDAGGGGAEAKFEAIVKSLRENDPNLDEATAWEKAISTNPDVYADYVAEQEG